MLVNLKKGDHDLNGLESLPIRNQGFDRHVVRDMVRAYRVANKNSIRYSHFNAFEILALFAANGVLNDEIAKLIVANEEHIKKFGMKIYLATHISDTTPPLDDFRSYIGKTTTVLCNTEITDDLTHKYLFRDLLDDVVSLAHPNRDVDGGQGLDQAEVAPPYHDGSPEDDSHDVGFPL